MRIGLVTGSFLPRVGGLEWKVHFLAGEYQRRGHEAVVFHARLPRQYAGPLPIKAHYEIVTVGPRPFPGYGRLGICEWFFGQSLLTHHRRKPFDVLHCHSLELPARHGVLMKHRTGVPVVATTCGHDIMSYPAMGFGIRLRRYYDRMVRDNVNQVDVIGSISSGVAQELKAMGAKARIVDIPNGVDWSAFQGGSNGWLKQRLGLTTSDVLVVSLGRNHPVKGYASGIRAFAKAAGSEDRAYYALIGQGTASLAPLADELGIKGRVHFLEAVSMTEVPTVLCGADVFFSPSLMEGFPQVVAQAMACGRPCVLSDCPGNEDLKNHPGVTFGRAGDPDSLSGALRKILSDPEKRRQMGIAAHDGSSRFSWSSIAGAYLGIFEKLAAKQRVCPAGV